MIVDKKHNSLNFKQKIQLAKLITDEFVSSDKTDKEFAEYASEKLEFTVTLANMSRCREDLDIPSNKSRKIAENNDFTSRINNLELRVKSLENRVEVYLKGSRGDSK